MRKISPLTLFGRNDNFMNVVIFSGGNVEDGFFVQRALKNAKLIIAADSGYESALQFGVKPSILVGDLDSVEKKILNQVQDDKEIEIVQLQVKKDETDTQLAVDVALQKGATEISILGGVEGNRIDHALANMFLSSYSSSEEQSDDSRSLNNNSSPFQGKRQARTIKIYFINGNQKTWIENGPANVQIFGKKGDLLSLIPISEKVKNISTENLQYVLKNYSLQFGIPRGISNVFLRNSCSVSFAKGRLLFTQTRAKT